MAAKSTGHNASESSRVNRILATLNKQPGCLFRKKHGSAMGVVGDPDIYGSVGGRMVVLEVKKDGNVPTKIQEHRLQEWKDAGAIAAVVHTAEEAMEVLRGVL